MALATAFTSFALSTETRTSLMRFEFVDSV